MNKKTKKRLVVAGTAAAIFYYGFRKFNAAKEVLTSLKYNLDTITNFKVSNGQVMFNALISIQNPTNIDFGATISSQVAVKKIKVYTAAGDYLGAGVTNVYSVNIPAGSSIELPAIPMILETQAALKEFSSNIFKYLGNDFSNLRFKIEVEAFGKAITIDAN